MNIQAHSGEWNKGQILTEKINLGTNKMHAAFQRNFALYMYCFIQLHVILMIKCIV